MSTKRSIVFSIGVTLILALGACGQTGPLVLPPSEKPNPSVDSPAPQPPTTNMNLR